VEWAMAHREHGQYSWYALGGHSGGGPAALASGFYLAKRVGSPRAVVLQHPGAVAHLNVPGCSKNHGGSSSAKADCDEFFPADMLASIDGTVLHTCGTFCADTKAENSNWFHSNSCKRPRKHDRDPNVACHRNFLSEKLGQPDVTCAEGKCANAPWLANPSDCMISTECEDVFRTFVDPAPGSARPSGGGVMFKHCGEHEFSVVGPYGLKQEGKLAVIPFLRGVAEGGAENAKNAVLASNGRNEKCYMQKRGEDSGLNLVHPRRAAMKYMLAEASPYHWLSASSKISVRVTEPR